MEKAFSPSDDWRSLDRLSQRDMVLLGEILRIENELERYAALRAEGERIMYELLLTQFELVVGKLSSEDDELWGHVWRVVDWLRFEALQRSEQGYSLAAMIERAEAVKGGPLSREEYEQFSELAQEIADVDRELSADG
jgi:hypothetical protein